MGEISKKLVAIQREIDAIAKERNNAQQGYKFRSIYDVYNMVHPLFTKHDVVIIPRVTDSKIERVTDPKGKLVTFAHLLVEYTYLAEDGSSIVSSGAGEGSDYADKATQKAQSAAQKYNIIQMFTIPTEDLIDGDKETLKVASNRPTPVKVSSNGKASVTVTVPVAQKGADTTEVVENNGVVAQIKLALRTTYPDGVPMFDSEKIKQTEEKMVGKGITSLDSLLKTIKAKITDKLAQAKRGAA